MSLATDILKRLAIDLSPPPRSQQKPTATKPAPVKQKGPRKQKVKRPPRKYEQPPCEKIPGVSFRSDANMWDAYTWDGEKTIRIGLFRTQARAAIALRLYKFWRKRAYKDIPRKPTVRVYTRVKIAD